jgi:hypothetical protein
MLITDLFYDFCWHLTCYKCPPIENDSKKSLKIPKGQSESVYQRKNTYLNLLVYNCFVRYSHIPLNEKNGYWISSLMCMFYKSVFLLYFFFWPLCCLFFDIRILIAPSIDFLAGINYCLLVRLLSMERWRP